ncbi:uncharacterized protein LOC118910348 [Manis pentadactyla]|uniref:uncharacterized protein LOC118910348 n=1 Tax=Manis pentadactyla TaxID=143292 RepID=UPI00255C70BD|nr:uncharacterized protein LOC118910348 [Manis pentadactyla]
MALCRRLRTPWGFFTPALFFFYCKKIEIQSYHLGYFRLWAGTSHHCSLPARPWGDTAASHVFQPRHPDLRQSVPPLGLPAPYPRASPYIWGKSRADNQHEKDQDPGCRTHQRKRRDCGGKRQAGRREERKRRRIPKRNAGRGRLRNSLGGRENRVAGTCLGPGQRPAASLRVCWESGSVQGTILILFLEEIILPHLVLLLSPELMSVPKPEEGLQMELCLPQNACDAADATT